MQKKLSLGLALGFYGNLLFVIFAIVCYIYYSLYDPESGFTKALEIIAYACEFAGFGLLVAADVLISITTRMRKWFKILFSFYIIMEAVMMYCELNSFAVKDFYSPYSLGLAVAHSLISAVVCFSFVSLDPYKSPYEATIIICIGVILGGMFGNILNIRIYFSILVNAVAFTGLFAVTRSMLKRNIIEIDCHGDSARVAEYKGVFGSDDDDDEADDKEKNK